MDYKCAIFDMDGTLLDSMGMWRSMAGRMLQSVGVELTSELGEKLEQQSLRKSIEYFRKSYPQFKDVTDEDVRKFSNQYIANVYKNEIKHKPDADRFVRLLHNRGIKTAVASLTETAIVKSALAAQNMLEDFDFIVSTTDVGQDKNSPAVYLRCSDEFGLKPQECAVFEDSLYAAKTAKEAGFYVVGVFDKYANSDSEEFSQICDRVIRDWSELCVE